MAEGSGGGEGQIGDDEEEYGGAHGSGDGSGDGKLPIPTFGTPLELQIPHSELNPTLFHINRCLS